MKEECQPLCVCVSACVVGQERKKHRRRMKTFFEVKKNVCLGIARREMNWVAPHSLRSTVSQEEIFTAMVHSQSGKKTLVLYCYGAQSVRKKTLLLWCTVSHFIHALFTPAHLHCCSAFESNGGETDDTEVGA